MIAKIMIGIQFSGCITLPSNLNLKRKQRGMAELETGGQELRSACDTKQRNGERKRRKLSTGIGRKAWKQAGRKRKAKGTKGTGEHRRNRCQGRTGRREKKGQKAE